MKTTEEKEANHSMGVMCAYLLTILSDQLELNYVLGWAKAQAKESRTTYTCHP